MENLIAVDLFSGAGGLSIGLEKAGFTIIMANELEKDFAKTYELNHPRTQVLQDDIRKIDFKSINKALGVKRVHLLAGGPPCQGFSTVGSKKENDPRNTLLFEFTKAAKALNPDYILFENVAGFKRLYQGNAHHALISELHNQGYETTSCLLEASDFGLPQYRQRTIVIAWKVGLPPINPPTPLFYNEKDLFQNQTKLTLLDAISDLPELKANDEKRFYTMPPINDYQARMRANCSELTEHNSSNYGEKMLSILEMVPPGGSVEDLPLHLRPKSYFKNTYARLLPDKPSPTITRNFGTPSSSRCIHPSQNRALSTREGARLQGFPDNYLFYGSKTSKNLQIGNAVPPIFGEIIANSILNSIRQMRLAV
ncbi:MAG: DNA cytosine methyltransferase [Pseudomonadota bacterium]